MLKFSDENDKFRNRPSECVELKTDNDKGLGLFCRRFFKMFHNGLNASNEEEVINAYCENIFNLVSKSLAELPDEQELFIRELTSKYSDFQKSKQAEQKGELQNKVARIQQQMGQQYLAIQRLEREGIEASTLLRSLTKRQGDLNREKLDKANLRKNVKILT